MQLFSLFIKDSPSLLTDSH